jgi:hypothetical protein
MLPQITHDVNRNEKETPKGLLISYCLSMLRRLVNARRFRNFGKKLRVRFCGLDAIH